MQLLLKMKNIPIRHITSTHKERDNAGRFNIRDVQQLLGANNLIQELHRHDFFFVLALQKGKGTHEIDFTSYKIYDNSIFILRPGQVHQLELKAGCTGFLMEFDNSFYHSKDKLANQRLKKASRKNFCKPEVSRFKKLLAVLKNISNEFAVKQEGYTEVIKANLDIFFIEFTRQSQNPQSDLKNTGTYSQQRFEEFSEVLESRVTQLKNVSQYAELLNLSPYQLNAITKASVGKTVSELINEQIILEAKRHLLATPNQIKDIADQLGYEDVSYFIRFFKKYTGYSPESFRSNFK